MSFGSAGLSQYSRRTDKSITTARPSPASSARCRKYRECTQSQIQPGPVEPGALAASRDGPPQRQRGHNGHSAATITAGQPLKDRG